MVQTTRIRIEWDGEHLPKELAELPPGHYDIVLVGDTYELTDEEEALVQEGLDDIAAGRVRPVDDVIRELRERIRRP
jgi:hypothetical protein